MARCEHLQHKDRDAADEIEQLRDALVRIQDLTQHNMGMSAKDETCVWREATNALRGQKNEQS